MRSLIVSTGLLISGALAAPASAQIKPPTAAPASASAAQEAKALLALSAFDVQLTPDLIAAVGLTEALAIRVAQDSAAPRYQRIRAIGALGLMGSAGAREIVRALARTANDEEVKIQAIISLSRGFARTAPAQLRLDLRALKAAPSGHSLKVSKRLTRELSRLDAQP